MFDDRFNHAIKWVGKSWISISMILHMINKEIKYSNIAPHELKGLRHGILGVEVWAILS